MLVNKPGVVIVYKWKRKWNCKCEDSSVLFHILMLVTRGNISVEICVS